MSFTHTDPHPASIELMLLGPFEIASGPQNVQRLTTSKGIALLAYLALQPERAHSRSSLAALLWPDISEQHARDNLRSTLHRLRRELDEAAGTQGDILTNTRQTVQLDRSHLAIDALTFQHALDVVARHPHRALAECESCLERLDEAAALYRGDLLAGFDLPDAEPFEEWLLLRREFFRHQAIVALNGLAAAFESRGEAARAQQYTQRVLELDPLREESYRQLMRLLARQQMPDRALSQYEALRELLARELGVEPSDATVELVQQISRGEYSGPTRPKASTLPTAPPAPAPVSSAMGDIPQVALFFGRTPEQQWLQESLLADEVRMIALLGLGGVGKTTLAAYVVARLCDRFDAVFWRSLVNAPRLTELLRPMLQYVQRAQPFDHLPKGLDEQLAHLFAYFQHNRVLLVLDDVDSILDGRKAGYFRAGYEAYEQLFTGIVQRQHQSLLLLTSRERPANVNRWSRDTSQVRALRLAGLSDEAARELLAQRGLKVPTSDQDAITERYSGNPLALKLVADTVQETFNGDVSLFLTEQTVVFDSLRTILDEQFARLTPLELDILFWLAVARQPLAAPEIRASLLRSPSQSELVAALGGLQRRSLIERAPSGFTLQTVVAEYITGRLIEEGCNELESGQLRLLHAYALLHTHAEEHVRAGQVRFLLAPLAELFAARVGALRVAAHFRTTLGHLRITRPGEPSYAGGNLLNLLLQQQAELQGLDFSTLAVWNGYLRGMELQAVDLSQSDLTGTVFTDTFGAVYSVAFSPTDDLLAAGTADGEILLWRAVDLQPVARLEGHVDSVWSVAFSPDGATLVSVSADQTARIWDVETHALRQVLLDHGTALQAVAFRPDGQQFATGGGDGIIRLWKPDEEHPHVLLKGHTGWIRDLAFSSSGDKLASASADATVRVWDAVHGRLLWTRAEHSSGVDSIAFHPSRTLLASGGEDGTIHLWDVAAGKSTGQFAGHTGPVRTLAFAPDGHTLASGSDDRTIRLWDLTTGRTFFILHGHANWVVSVAFSRQGTTLLSGGEDRTVRTWNTADGEPRQALQGYTNWIYCVAFSPDDRTILSGSGDCLARIWDTASNSALLTFRGHTNWVWTAAFSPDGRTVASASSDGTILIWEAASGTIVHKLEGHPHWVRAVTFSPDGATLASGAGDHTIALWDVATGTRLQQLHGHSGWVRGLVYSSDGKTLASASEDHTIRLWNPADGTLQHVLTGHTSRVDAVAFSPDGRLLASGSEDQTIRIWTVDTGVCERILTGHEGWIRAVDISPDGAILASGSHDRSVRLWDLRSGALLHVLASHDGWVTSVDFDSTGSRLASGNSDGAIRLWEAATGTCLATLRVPGPYAGMNIDGARGLTEAQRVALLALGAEESLSAAP